MSYSVQLTLKTTKGEQATLCYFNGRYRYGTDKRWYFYDIEKAREVINMSYFPSEYCAKNFKQTSNTTYTVTWCKGDYEIHGKFKIMQHSGVQTKTTAEQAFDNLIKIITR